MELEGSETWNIRWGWQNRGDPTGESKDACIDGGKKEPGWHGRNSRKGLSLPREARHK